VNCTGISRSGPISASFSQRNPLRAYPGTPNPEVAGRLRRRMKSPATSSRLSGIAFALVIVVLRALSLSIS
jgi:hypothetical protein